jgi:hypothetical protein
MVLESTARFIAAQTIDDSALVSSTVPENDAPTWDSGTTYDADDEVIVDDHIIYVSAQGSNTNHDPTTDDGTWWTPTLATNQWKVFDGFLQDKASQSDSAEWVVQAANTITGIALISVSAASVQVVMNDATDGEVYNETFDLIDESFVTDYDDWFFQPAQFVPDFAITDLPPYPAEITVTLTNTGGTVELGQLVIGQQYDLGITVNGLGLTNELYSSKQPDAFGRVSAVKRGSADLLEPTVKVLTQRIPFLQATLKAREALPTVYLFDGPNKVNEYIAYGDFTSMQMRSEFGAYSTLDLEIREYVS